MINILNGEDKQLAKQSREHLSYSKTLTNVNMFLAILLALASTILTYGLVNLYLQDYAVYRYLFERGPIPYFITFLFFLAIAILFLKTFRIKNELKAFALLDRNLFSHLSSSTASHIRADEAENMIEVIKKFSDKEKKLMLVNRIDKAAQRLRNTKSSAEMDDIMTSLSDIDHKIIESSYTGVRFIAGVIPILGFLGTVYGISIAITKFTSVLERASDFEGVKPALNLATTNLGIAFDTTLIALLFSGLILLINALIQKREEDLLSAVDSYCIDRFISRIQVIPEETQQISEAIQEQTNKLVSSMESHTNISEELMQTVVNEIKNVKNTITVIDKTLENITPPEGAAIKDQIEAIVDLLDTNIQGLQDRLQEISDSQKEPIKELGRFISEIKDFPEKLKPLKDVFDSFEGLGDLGDTFKKFEDSLNELKPVIQNLSDEMAGKINHMLFSLLKVNIVGHQIDIMDKDRIRSVDFDGILNNLFKEKGEKKNGKKISL